MPHPRLRLFVAAYPPPDVAESLLARLDAFDLAPCRRTPLEQLHLTIQFLGPTPVRDLDAVKTSVRRAASGIGAFHLQAHRLLTLPARGLPRLVAAELDQPAGLMELQRRLATRLARPVRSKPGERYLPHITLCRFGPAGAAPLQGHPLNGHAFDVTQISLMKSVLHPQGAQHAAVDTIDLD